MVWRDTSLLGRKRSLKPNHVMGVLGRSEDVLNTNDIGNLMAAVESIPLFPLPGTVFIPHTLLPLHVFEPRYRDLVDDVMSGSKILAVPRLRPGWERQYDGSPAVFETAGFGKIIQYDPLPDGRANIVIAGLGRLRIRRELQPDSLYRVAEGSIVSDTYPEGGAQALDASLRRLRMMLAQIMAGRLGLTERLSPLLDKRLEAAQLVNGLGNMLLPDVDARQRFLETRSIVTRVELVETMLAGALIDAVAHA